MPLYSALCLKCGTSHGYFAKVSERENTPTCCDAQTTKTLDAPMVSAMAFTGHKGFLVPGTTTWIEDGAQAKAYMKKNNLISEAEGAQEATHQRTQRERAEDKKIDAAIVNAYRKHSGVN